MALHNWLCASWLCTSLLGAMCFARTAPRDFSCESGLRKLHCSRMLRASCSLQAAARKCSVQVALRKCSEQVALRKCSAPVAPCKCSVQTALRKLLCASDSAQVALRKCCRSCGNVLRVLFLYIKVAIFQPELRECAPRTTFVLKSCDFPAGAAGTLRILRLYLKVTIFQPELQEHAPRTTFVLKSCDFQAEAAADQRGIEPATAGLRKQARKPRDNFQRPFREQQNRTAPQRERFDTHDLRRGSRGHRKKRPKKNLELHLDHADLRRGAKNAKKSFSRGNIKRKHKNREFLHLDHAGLRRGSRGHIKQTQETLSFCTSTTPISAEGRAGHADPRRGSHSRLSATSPPPAKKEILNTELFLFLSRALST